MKKSDLKSGMMVKIERQEELSLILIGTKQGDVMCNLMPTMCNGMLRHYNYFSLEYYNKDLTSCDSATGDIIKVYNEYGRLLWKRDEAKEYTMTELIEKVGHNFKIKE